MSKKKGLGKGIGALIPEIGEEILERSDEIVQVRIDEIKTNPFQPRKKFSDEQLTELASSIKEQGILMPLLVKQDDTGYELIAGERRLRAAYKAGLSVVPIIIKKVDEKTRQELALIENIQREDLNVIEEAEAYQSLIDRFYYTQEDVSRRVGKSRSAVTNALRLLKLSGTIKEDLLQDSISMGHARAYLGLETEAAQEAVHRKVITRGLSVRQTEKIVLSLKNNNKRNNQKPKPQENKYSYVQDELQKRFATKVNIDKKGKKGKVVIEFYSDEEFERIYTLLRG